MKDTKEKEKADVVAEAKAQSVKAAAQAAAEKAEADEAKALTSEAMSKAANDQELAAAAVAQKEAIAEQPAALTLIGTAAVGKVFHFLDKAVDVVRLSATCSLCSKLAHTDSIWRNLAQYEQHEGCLMSRALWQDSVGRRHLTGMSEGAGVELALYAHRHVIGRWYNTSPEAILSARSLYNRCRGDIAKLKEEKASAKAKAGATAAKLADAKTDEEKSAAAAAEQKATEDATAATQTAELARRAEDAANAADEKAKSNAAAAAAAAAAATLKASEAGQSSDRT